MILVKPVGPNEASGEGGAPHVLGRSIRDCDQDILLRDACYAGGALSSWREDILESVFST